MACYHPVYTWMRPGGAPTMARHQRHPDEKPIRLPCSHCVGCRKSTAQQWALRCSLEEQQHPYTIATTLTINDDHLPPTLEIRALSRFNRRLRRSLPNMAIRMFGCGEYGETGGRPHYHNIIFGLGTQHTRFIEAAWRDSYGAPIGNTQVLDATPGLIAYIAGYDAKKYNTLPDRQTERVDPSTGEVYKWQPPFLLMSRRPGIGAHAKQWPDMWRLYAINQGTKQPVPRYLHNAWKEQATPREIEELENERYELTQKKDLSEMRLHAMEQIALKELALKREKRTL